MMVNRTKFIEHVKLELNTIIMEYGSTPYAGMAGALCAILVLKS